MGASIVIAVEDPRTEDVRALLETHLRFSHDVTPAGFVFALDIDGLVDPSVTFLTARRDGELLGMGALKKLDDEHGEIKSMHTAMAARGTGVGKMILQRLLELAASRNWKRVSLETGTTRFYEPARKLYETAGFTACGAYGDYQENAHSYFMTRLVSDRISEPNVPQRRD